MAEPKKRVSKSRKNIRRTNHKSDIKQLMVCKTCGKKTIPHAICKYCETYNK